MDFHLGWYPFGENMAGTQEHRFIGVVTPLGEDVLLLNSFSYSEALGGLFELELDLLAESTDLQFADIVGQNVTVRLDLPGDKKRYFNGYVSRFSLVGQEGDSLRYSATVVPWLWFLTRTSDCHIFQNKTVPDIIKEIFGKHGSASFEEALSGDYRTWEYCVQYRETDFNFVSRLMEQEGLYYFFKHEDGKHSLVLADSPSAHKPYAGYETIPYYPPTQQTREQEYISDWDIEQEVQPRVFTHTDFNFKEPGSDLVASRRIDQGRAGPDFEIFDYPGEYTSLKEGETYARTRIEEIHAGCETLRGETTARGLSAGFTFDLTNHPRQDQQRNHLVTSVSLSATTPGFYSGGTEEQGFSCSFTAVDAKQPYRVPRSTPKPSVPGPQTAMVVGPSGEEIYTDEYGRVKVQFHWDRYGTADENSSCWVRVAQLWAGKKWGAMYIPRLGQEVIVEFLEGDPDQPIITGRVYNAQSMPPYDPTANKTVSTIMSNSSKGGGGFNEIRFEDKKGSEQIFVHAQKDRDIVVENNETHSVGNDRQKSVGNDETTSVGSNRTEDVGENENITIGGNRTESVGKNENISIGANRSENVSKNESVTIGENQDVSVAKNRQHTVGKDEKLSVGDNRRVSVGKNHTLNVGKKLQISAGDEIVLKTGSATIMMKKNGDITIKGKKINIKASGDIKMKGSKIAEN